MSTTLRPEQVNTSIFGMASAVFTSACAALVTTAVKGNELITHTANTLIHSASAAENVTAAVEKRSKIYGDAIVENGKLAEREGTLKHQMRLYALEAKEKAVREGRIPAEFADTFSDKLQKAMSDAKNSVLGLVNSEDTETTQEVPTIRSAARRNTARKTVPM